MVQMIVEITIIITCAALGAAIGNYIEKKYWRKPRSHGELEAARRAGDIKTEKGKEKPSEDNQ